MSKQYDTTPRIVKTLETKNRRIATAIPHHEASKIIAEMREHEPKSMTGQPPVIWDRAEGFNVYDKWGNKWIDMTSCVLVANVGHCNPEVQKAIIDVVEHKLLNSYCFPNEPRSRLVKRLSELAPKPLKKVFLLSTGGESTECAIKLCRTYGYSKGGMQKIKIITFDDAFHGRTMGAQMAGGSSNGKKWIVNLDKDIIQVPFPNAFKYKWADEQDKDYSDDICFEKFLRYLKEKGVQPDEIAGIMTETFQGGWVQLMPKGFVQRLRKFCTQNDIVLVFDEVQAGFGRTGKLFGFEHAEVIPDLICCGKGISSSLPLSCVIGREDIMNLYGPNEMTSTHSGNPVCCSAALASINYLIDNDVISYCAKLGKVCIEKLHELQAKYPDVIGWVSGIGLVYSVITVKKGTKDLDCDLAHDIVQAAMEKGVLLFAPVGAGATIKICPPLIIDRDALIEALDVLDEAIGDVMASRK